MNLYSANQSATLITNNLHLTRVACHTLLTSLVNSIQFLNHKFSNLVHPDAFQSRRFSNRLDWFFKHFENASVKVIKIKLNLRDPVLKSPLCSTQTSLSKLKHF